MSVMVSQAGISNTILCCPLLVLNHGCLQANTENKSKSLHSLWFSCGAFWMDGWMVGWLVWGFFLLVFFCCCLFVFWGFFVWLVGFLLAVTSCAARREEIKAEGRGENMSCWELQIATRKRAQHCLVQKGLKSLQGSWIAPLSNCWTGS